MTLNLKDVTVPIRMDESGTARIGETRVILDIVIGEFMDGASPEEIVSMYSSLELADVYAVIAYYLRNKSEVDAYLLEREHQAEELRRKIEAKFNPQGLRERLLARLEERST